MSPQVTSPGKESESYSSLKERRKSLTPVIIVLSSSSQILLAECLTDPIGKSFTLHLLHQLSQERSFYLPASISQSLCLSNCSLCSRLAVLSARGKSLPPLDYQSLEACHQHSFENGFTGSCSCACCLFDLPKSQALLVLATVLLQGLSLFFSRGLSVRPTRDQLFLSLLVRLSFPGGFFHVIYSS